MRGIIKNVIYIKRYIHYLVDALQVINDRVFVVD